MLNRSLLNTSLLLAGLITLAACSSDSTDDDAPINPPTTTGDTGSGGDNSDNTDPTSGNTGTDLANSIPQIVTAACGDLPVSETLFSNIESAPAVFAVDEIVRGRVDPDSATNGLHFWNIELQPGFYHVVLDTRRVDDENTNLGLRLVNANGPGEEDDLVLLDNNTAFIYATRQSLFLEVETAETLNLQVSSIHGAEDYTMGIFENGSAVPSPVMEECPTIPTLSLDSTQSVVLPSHDSEADELWFQIELELGDYILSSTANRVDGENRNIVYTFRSVDQFAETDRFQEVSSVNVVDIMHSDSGVLTVSEAGLTWIRLRSGTTPQNIEFTLSRDN